MKRLLVILILVLGVSFISTTCLAKDTAIAKGSTGQTVFLALGKFNATGFSSVKQLLNSKIFVRNTDMDNPITITSVKVYGPDGIVEGDEIYPVEFVGGDPIVLNPLASTSFPVDNRVPREPDGSGGRHCAIITWESDIAVNPPGVASAILINLPVDPDDESLGFYANTHSVARGIVIE